MKTETKSAKKPNIEQIHNLTKLGYSVNEINSMDSDEAKIIISGNIFAAKKQVEINQQKKVEKIKVEQAIKKSKNQANTNFNEQKYLMQKESLQRQLDSKSYVGGVVIFLLGIPLFFFLFIGVICFIAGISMMAFTASERKRIQKEMDDLDYKYRMQKIAKIKSAKNKTTQK